MCVRRRRQQLTDAGAASALPAKAALRSVLLGRRPSAWPPGRLAAWPAPRRLGQVDNQRPLRTQTSLARPRAPAPPRPFPGELRRAQLPPCALATGVAHLRQALPAPGRREEHTISRAGSARGRAGSGPRPRPPQHRGPPPGQTVSGLETRAPLTTQPPRSGAGSVLARPRGLRHKGLRSRDVLSQRTQTWGVAGVGGRRLGSQQGRRTLRPAERMERETLSRGHGRPGATPGLSSLREVGFNSHLVRPRGLNADG